MSSLVVLAMMAAATVGPYLPHPAWFVHIGCQLIIAVFIILCFGSILKTVLGIPRGLSLTRNNGLILAFLWVFLHSPPPWPMTIGIMGTVLDSSGCGLVSDDLLVEAGGNIWQARGESQVGDDVVRSSRPTLDLIPRVDTVVGSDHSSPWCSLSALIRQALLLRFDVWSPGAAIWLKAFTLGANAKIDGVTETAFRNLNLLHVVVLSGSHVSILAAAILFLLRLVPLCLYSTRIMTMRVWPIVWHASALLSLVVVFFFCLSVGLGQSVQRAMLGFAFMVTGPLLWGARRGLERLTLVFAIQAIIFPINLCSLSMFLTWTGTLVLSALTTSHFRRHWIETVREALLIQLVFSLVSALTFGRIAILGFVANVLLLPAFSLCLPLNFFLLMQGQQTYLGKILVNAQMHLLDFVRRLSMIQGRVPILNLRLPAYLTIQSILGRLIAVILIAALTNRLIERRKLE